MGGAFLVPDGWSFRTEQDQRTVAYFITAQEFVPPALFETGVSINAFLGDPTATVKLERIVRTLAERHSVEIITSLALDADR